MPDAGTLPSLKDLNLAVSQKNLPSIDDLNLAVSHNAPTSQPSVSGGQPVQSGDDKSDPFGVGQALINSSKPNGSGKPLQSNQYSNAVNQIFNENPGLKSFSNPQDYLVQDAAGKMQEILAKNKFGLEFQNKGETDYQVGNDKLKLDNPDKYRVYIDPNQIKPEERYDAIKLDILSHALHNNPQYQQFSDDLKSKLYEKYGKKEVEANDGVDGYIRGYLSNSPEYAPYKKELSFLPSGYFDKLDSILKTNPTPVQPKSNSAVAKPQVNPPSELEQQAAKGQVIPEPITPQVNNPKNLNVPVTLNVSQKPLAYSTENQMKQNIAAIAPDMPSSGTGEMVKADIGDRNAIAPTILATPTDLQASKDIQDANAALQQNPNDVNAMFKAGYAYQSTGNIPTAKSAYKNILDIDPTNPDANQNLGYLSYLDKDYDKSLNYYQTALKAKPNDSNLALGVAQNLWQKAKVAPEGSSENLAQAKNIIDQITANDNPNLPTNTQAWQIKGLIEHDLGKKEDSDKAFQQANNARTNNTPIAPLEQKVDPNTVNPNSIRHQLFDAFVTPAAGAVNDVMDLKFAENGLVGIADGMSDIHQGLGDLWRYRAAGDTPNGVKNVGGTIQALNGGAKVLFGGLSFTPEGFEFTQGINVADKYTNGQAGKLLMQPLSYLYTPDSKIGQNTQDLLNTVVTLGAFAGFHKLVGGDAAGYQKTTDAIKDFQDGKYLSGDQVKTLVQDIHQNATPENFGAIKSAIDLLPKDTKAENVIPNAKSIVINETANDHINSLTSQVNEILKKDVIGSVDLLKIGDLEKQIDGVNNAIDEQLNTSSPEINKQIADLQKEKDGLYKSTNGLDLQKDADKEKQLTEQILDLQNQRQQLRSNLLNQKIKSDANVKAQPKEKPLPNGFREVAESEVLPAGDYKTIMNFEGTGKNITDAPLKENKNAVQEQKPVPVRQQAQDGEAVGEGNTVNQKPTEQGEGEKEVRKPVNQIITHPETEDSKRGLVNTNDDVNPDRPNDKLDAEGIAAAKSTDLTGFPKIETSENKRTIEAANLAKKDEGVVPTTNPLLNTLDVPKQLEGTPSDNVDYRKLIESDKGKEFQQQQEKLFDYKKEHPDTAFYTHSSVEAAQNALEATGGKWTDETTDKFVAEKEKQSGEPQEKAKPTPEESRQFAIDMVNSGLVEKGADVRQAGDKSGARVQANTNERLDLEMSSADRNKAIADIKEGNYETAPAKKLIEKLSDFHQKDEFPYMRGTGGTTDRFMAMNREQMGKYMEKDASDLIDRKEAEITKFLYDNKYLNDNGDIDFKKLSSDLEDNDKSQHWGGLLELNKEEINHLKQLTNEAAKNESTSEAKVNNDGNEGEDNGKVKTADEKDGEQKELKGDGKAASIPTNQEEGAPVSQPEPENGEGGTSGIAQRIREKRADILGLQPADIGVGWSRDEALERGRSLLRQGVDPHNIIEDFNKDGKISDDTIAVVQAHVHDLAKATNEAGDTFGTDSKEYEDAKKAEDKFLQESKPMQTVWNRAGVAQQGDISIDTGSVTGLTRAFEESKGKPLTKEENEQAKQTADKIRKLEKERDDYKNKLTELLDNQATGEKEVSRKELAKQRLDSAKREFRKAAGLSSGGLEALPEFIKLVKAYADYGFESAKEAFEQFRKDFPKAAILQKDFAKHYDEQVSKLADKSETDKVKADKKKFTDLVKSFAEKTDNKFTPEEAKGIWDYARKEYIDKGVDFDRMISNVATDMGLTPEQVRDALVAPKGAKPITEEMYRKQYQMNQAKQHAEDWVKAAGNPKIAKFLGSIPRFFFALKTFGHGTVGFLTHAAVNLFDPVEWKRYFPSFLKQFKFAYGDTGKYEQAMQDLKNDPDFHFWRRAGLAVDPSERYDDYQFVTKIFQKMGTVGKWLTAGDRGFNALKVYRLARAKALYEGLSNVEKADPETAGEIAKLVNHSTGTSKVPLPESANVAFFAPRLEVSRWNKLISDPAKAVKTFSDWKGSDPSEKVAAKIVAARAGRILATYAGGLIVNQALLSLSGSKQSINLTNPQKSDWLKFKADGYTMDLTGGMVSTLDFLTNMAHIATESKKEVKTNRTDQLKSSTWNYVTGKLSPFGSTVKDFATHHDFQGNTLPNIPFVQNSQDKPYHQWNKQLTWKEYLEQQQTPIPVAEAFNNVERQMEAEGVKESTAKQWMAGIFIGSLVGGTGVKVGSEPKQTDPLTKEDKKDPAIKYFTDKGFEMPYTSLSSEQIKDHKTSTIKKLSDYPKPVQDAYIQTHKEALKKELSKAVSNGYVYTNQYGEVSLKIPETPTKGDKYSRIQLSKLSDEQTAELLHKAQAKATETTKKKMFNQ